MGRPASRKGSQRPSRFRRASLFFAGDVTARLLGGTATGGNCGGAAKIQGNLSQKSGGKK